MEKIINTKIQFAFLELLQAGLWTKKPNQVLFDGMSHDEWKSLFLFSRNQTVEGIVYDGIQRLSPAVAPPKQIILKWAVRVQQIEESNKEMNDVIEEQLSFFRLNGLQPVLVKGQGLARLYDHPLHRVCGDIDWCFQTLTDYRRANKLVQQQTKSFSLVPGYSSLYLWKNCHVEHHERLLDLHNPFLLRTVKGLESQAYASRLRTDVNGEILFTLSPTLNTVQINLHILKHCLGYGIGFRQLCDAARIYHIMYEKIEKHELFRIYKKLGVLDWIHVLHKVLVESLGLDQTKLPFMYPENVKTEWLIDEIIRSGNFGQFDEQHADKNNPGGRVNRGPRLWRSFVQHFPLAPLEATFYPLVYFLSRFQR